MPTVAQAFTAVRLCQMLSNLYQPINVFRYDSQLKTLYIQGGIADEYAILIDEQGEWEFVP